MGQIDRVGVEGLSRESLWSSLVSEGYVSEGFYEVVWIVAASSPDTTADYENTSVDRALSAMSEALASVEDSICRHAGSSRGALASDGLCLLHSSWWCY